MTGVHTPITNHQNLSIQWSEELSHIKVGYHIKDDESYNHCMTFCEPPNCTNSSPALCSWSIIKCTQDGWTQYFDCSLTNAVFKIKLPPYSCLYICGYCHGITLDLIGYSDMHEVLKWLLGYNLLFLNNKWILSICEN